MKWTSPWLRTLCMVMAAVMATVAGGLSATPLSAASADLAISKSDGQDLAAQGSALSYTIVASNLGPDAALGAAVADQLPADLDDVTWTCSATAGSSCPATGNGNLAVSVNLLASGSATFTVSGTIADDATGLLSNSATLLSPAGVADPNPSNNSATDTTQLTPLVDLFVSLDDGRLSAVPGESLVYTLVVGNRGPQVATDAVAQATFATGSTCSWLCSPSGDATCDAANGFGDLAQTVQLPSGGRLTYSVDCQIPSSALGNLISNAQVDAAAGHTEFALADNVASDSTSMAPVADVSVAVSDARTTAVPGSDLITYTVTVGNLGPSDAASVVVRDDFPDLLGDLAWTCLPTGAATCNFSGSGDLLETVNLPAGTSVRYFASASLPSSAQGTLNNVATVTPPSTVGDPNEANNQAHDLTTLTPQVDLQISKSDGTGSVVAGDTTIYTIQVLNLGPSDAPNTSILDPLPDGLTCSWTCLPTPGSSCDAGGSGDLDQLADLLQGGSANYTLDCQVDATASGTLSNSVTASPGAGIVEVNAANNSAQDINVVNAEADLQVSLTDQITEAVPGESLTYQLTVSNLGPSAVDEARVIDDFPAELDCRWTCLAQDGGQCTPGQVVGDIDDSVQLPVGAQLTYTALCSIDAAATGSLNNSATVEAAAAVDPFLGNNAASDADTVLTPQVDLTILKSDGLEVANAGQDLTYSLTLSNAGPSNAVGARVADPFSSLFSEVQWTCQGTAGALCPPSGTGDIDALVNLPTAASLTFTAIASLHTDAAGQVSNTASVEPAAGVAEVHAADNSATDTTQLQVRADVSILKSDGLTSAVPGQAISYLLTVANAGPSDAAATRVVDLLPETLIDATWTCAAEPGSACASSGVGDIDQLVDLEAGGSVIFTLDATIAADAVGMLSNTASVAVTGGVLDPLAANNTSSDVDTVLSPLADLVVELSNNATAVVPGRSIDYQLVVRNDGLSYAPVSRVTATLPAALNCIWTCQGSSGAECSAGPTSGDLLDLIALPPAGTASYTAQCEVDAASDGALTLTGNVEPSIEVTDPNPANNTAVDEDPLTPLAEVVVSKTDGRNSAVPGETLTYTIQVRNLGGPSDAPGVTVLDNFPAGLSCLWSCEGQGGAICATGQNSTDLLDVASLPVNGVATYTAQCAIDDDAVGPVVNGASATLPPGIQDSNLSNNNALDSTDLVPLVDLAIEVDDGVTDAVPGETLTYTVRVRHVSGGDIDGAEVRDIFPPQTSCLWTCQGLGGGICTPGQVQGDIVDSVDLPVASEVLYSAVCDISPDARGHLSNTASVELPNAAHDPNPADNASSDLDTLLTPEADLAVSNSDGVISVNPGGQVTYAIEVSNAGPSSVAGARVEDLFGQDLDCSWTCVTFDAATCTAGPISGDLVDSIDLPAASRVRYDGVCTVLAAAGSTLSNTARVEAPLDVDDPQPLNDEATDDDTRVEVVTDLSLDLTDGVTTATPGSTVTYALVVERTADALGFDPLPLGHPAAPGHLLWRRAKGEDGDALTLAALGHIPGRNCHELQWRFQDRPNLPQLGAWCFSDDATRVWSPLITSTQGETPQDEVALAHDHSWVVKATSVPVQLTVQSVLPAALTCQWTCSATPGSQCAVGPVDGGLQDEVTLAAAGRLTYEAQCLIDAAATGDLALGAQLVVPAGVIDPTLDDHQAFDVDNLQPAANLRLSKSDGVVEAAPGGQVVYTLVARNLGPSDAPASSITDLVSTSLSCLWSCEAEPGASCTAGHQAGDLLDQADLPAGSAVTYRGVCDIDSTASGTLSNTAHLQPSPSVIELQADDNTAADLDTALVPQGDLSLTLSDGRDNAVPGETLSYVLDVINGGPSLLQGVTVEDIFPDALSCLWSCTPSTGASCSAGQTAADLNDLVSLPADGSVRYDILCQIAPEARGTLLNSATVSAAAGAFDPDLANNQAVDDDTELQPSADLSITKTDHVQEVAPGDTLVYILEVHNAGPSSDLAATVQDLFPTVLSCQWSCDPSPGAVCNAGPVLGDLIDLAQLPVDGHLIYTAICEVATEASGPLLNNATVSTSPEVADPDLNSNSAADLDSVIPMADLALSKSDGVDEAVPGESLTYTLVASNPMGPSDVVEARLVDNVSNFLDCTWTCSSTGNADCGGATAQGDLDVSLDLPVGGVVTWSGSCSIDPAATGQLSNTAQLTPSLAVLDLNPSNNTASDTTQLVPTADLAVSKDDGLDELLAGASTTYILEVRNFGPSDAPAVTVSDPFPTFLSCSWSCVGQGGAVCADSVGVGDLLDEIDLPAFSRASYTTNCDVAPHAVGEIVNVVEIASDAAVDPDLSNNSATDINSLIDIADLALQIVDAPDPVLAGSYLLYGLTVENLGPAAEAEAQLTLALPSSVTVQYLVLGGPEVVFADGFESGTTSAWGTNGGVAGVCQRSGQNLTCQLGVLSANDARELTLGVLVDAAASGVLVLSGTLEGVGQDPVSSNNTATELTGVNEASTP